jgi:ankyrin repeat protein
VRKRLYASRLLLIPILALAGVAATGRTPSLISAVKARDARQVAALLQQGADVRGRSGDGTTALHWAAYLDEPALAEQLLAAGADVNQGNDLGVTPLWLACRNRSPILVAALLARGANANASLSMGETPLMQAALVGDVESVRQLLSHRADVDARERSHGQTALMWAASAGHADAVHALLQAGADVHARTTPSRRVVSTSSRVGVNPPTVYDMEGVIEVGAGGYTPILFAAQEGRLDAARLLLEAGADANDAAASGQTALVLAAHSAHTGRAQHTEVAALLLEHGADADAAAAGYTALHAAILAGDAPLVRALLAHKANPNLPLARGTPVRRFSADFALSRNLIGATPLWLAAKFGEPDMIQALVDHGADVSFSMRDGVTPLMVAISAGAGQDRRDRMFLHADAIAEMRDRDPRLTIEAVRVLLQARANVDASSVSGDTALHLAAARGLDAVVLQLAEAGARLDLRNKEGRTPLAVASGEGVRDKGKTADVLRTLGAR